MTETAAKSSEAKHTPCNSKFCLIEMKEVLFMLQSSVCGALPLKPKRTIPEPNTSQPEHLVQEYLEVSKSYCYRKQTHKK